MSTNVNDSIKRSGGQQGFRYITSSTTGNDNDKYSYLVVDIAGTFSATTDGDGDDLPSVYRGEGIVIPGDFSSVTVSDGAVRAYFAN